VAATTWGAWHFDSWGRHPDIKGGPTLRAEKIGGRSPLPARDSFGFKYEKIQALVPALRRRSL